MFDTDGFQKNYEGDEEDNESEDEGTESEKELKLGEETENSELIASQELPMTLKRYITSTQIMESFNSFGTPESSINASTKHSSGGYKSKEVSHYTKVLILLPKPMIT